MLQVVNANELIGRNTSPIVARRLLLPRWLRRRLLPPVPRTSLRHRHLLLRRRALVTQRRYLLEQQSAVSSRSRLRSRTLPSWAGFVVSSKFLEPRRSSSSWRVKRSSSYPMNHKITMPHSMFEARIRVGEPFRGQDSILASLRSLLLLPRQQQRQRQAPLLDLLPIRPWRSSPMAKCQRLLRRLRLWSKSQC